MSTILKGANFKGTTDSSKKKGNSHYKPKQDGRQGLKGPGTSAAGPFWKNKPLVQCYQWMGWGHYGQNCPNEYPVEGSINWENLKGEVVKEGGTLPHPSPNSASRSESTPSHARAVMSTISKRLNDRDLKGGGCVPVLEYHNPDPLVRLIGPANEGKVEIEGVKTTALIDTRACMSAMTKSFAVALELELKSLNSILDIEGTGGGKVPYHGYVECRLNLPQIEKFDQDVLILVIDDSPYGARVPIQIGTLHIDMAISLATEEEGMKFKKKWEHAKMASYLQMAGMQTKEPVINLEEINGTVHLTHNLSLGPFKTATISGLLKGPVKDSAYYKCVNVSVEPMSNHLNDDSKYCAVPGYTFLKPGYHRIHIMMKNLTARKITINQGAKVATMSAAKIVPHMLAPQELQTEESEVEVENNTKLLMKSASMTEDSRSQRGCIQ